MRNTCQNPNAAQTCGAQSDKRFGTSLTTFGGLLDIKPRFPRRHWVSSKLETKLEPAPRCYWCFAGKKLISSAQEAGAFRV